MHNALAQSAKLRVEQSRLHAKLKLAVDDCSAAEKRAEVRPASVCTQFFDFELPDVQAAESALDAQRRQFEEQNQRAIEAMQQAVKAAEACYCAISSCCVPHSRVLPAVWRSVPRWRSRPSRDFGRTISG